MARVSAGELLARLGKGKAIPAILLLGDEPYPVSYTHLTLPTIYSV